jgi:hypothetical protein
MKDPFLPLEEHFFEAVMVCKKNYDVEFEDIVFQTKEKLKPLQKTLYTGTNQQQMYPYI